MAQMRLGKACECISELKGQRLLYRISSFDGNSSRVRKNETNRFLVKLRFVQACGEEQHSMRSRQLRCSAIGQLTLVVGLLYDCFALNLRLGCYNYGYKLHFLTGYRCSIAKFSALQLSEQSVSPQDIRSSVYGVS